MKRFSIYAILMLSIFSGQSAQSIYEGKLQTDLNGGGKSITNVNELRATTLHGNGANLTGITAEAIGAVATVKTNGVNLLATGATGIDFVPGANTSVTGAVSGTIVKIGISSTASGGVFIEQGLNISAVTNSGLVTVSVYGLSTTNETKSATNLLTLFIATNYPGNSISNWIATKADTNTPTLFMPTLVNVTNVFLASEPLKHMRWYGFNDGNNRILSQEVVGIGTGSGTNGWQLILSSSPGDYGYMQMWMNPTHDGYPANPIRSELQWTMAGRLAISPGYGGSGANATWQHGAGSISDTNNGGLYEWMQGITQSDDTFGTNRGSYYSGSFNFKGGVRTNTGTGFAVHYRYPGFNAHGVTEASSTEGGWYELAIQKNLFATPSDSTWRDDTTVKGGAFRYSLDGSHADRLIFYGAGEFHGPLDLGRTNQTATNLVVNFETQMQDVSPATTNVYFSFVNQPITRGTNSPSKRVYLRSGALVQLALTWPSGMNVGGPTGTEVAPATLAQGKLLDCQFVAVGPGNTNVQAKFDIYTDNSFAFDADAAAFFTRASITDPTQKNAVNALVIDLKAASLWTKLDAIYPFVGGSATPHSKNLKADAFNITWNGGGPTHNANGITGDGVNDWGDTGWKPSVDAAQNSISMGVYCRSQTPTDARYLMGSILEAGTSRLQLIPNGANITSRVNDAADGSRTASTDFRGFIAVGRTSSTTYTLQIRTSQGGQGNTTTGVPDANLGLLCRNWTVSGPDTFSNANLAFAFAGDGLTSAELLTLETIVTTFESTLGRNAP